MASVSLPKCYSNFLIFYSIFIASYPSLFVTSNLSVLRTSTPLHLSTLHLCLNSTRPTFLLHPSSTFNISLSVSDAQPTYESLSASLVRTISTTTNPRLTHNRTSRTSIMAFPVQDTHSNWLIGLKGLRPKCAALSVKVV